MGFDSVRVLGGSCPNIVLGLGGLSPGFEGVLFQVGDTLEV